MIYSYVEEKVQKKDVKVEDGQMKTKKHFLSFFLILTCF